MHFSNQFLCLYRFKECYSLVFTVLSKSSLNILLPILAVNIVQRVTMKWLLKSWQIYDTDLRQVYIMQTDASKDFLKFIRKYFSQRPARFSFLENWRWRDFFLTFHFSTKAKAIRISPFFLEKKEWNQVRGITSPLSLFPNVFPNIVKSQVSISFKILAKFQF